MAYVPNNNNDDVFSFPYLRFNVSFAETYVRKSIAREPIRKQNAPVPVWAVRRSRESCTQHGQPGNDEISDEPKIVFRAPDGFTTTEQYATWNYNHNALCEYVNCARSWNRPFEIVVGGGRRRRRVREKKRNASLRVGRERRGPRSRHTFRRPTPARGLVRHFYGRTFATRVYRTETETFGSGPFSADVTRGTWPKRHEISAGIRPRS